MSLGPNRPLICRPPADLQAALSTPALVVDLDAFEANVALMASVVKAHGRNLRPHAKAHKSPIVAKKQLAAGAVGICCASVREAEVMASAGIEGILVTTPVVTPSMCARVAAAAERTFDFTVVVDSLTAIENYALHARREKPLGVLIDIDMGFGREGLVDPRDALVLARRIGELPQLRYRGVQAYYGHLQHVKTIADRHEKVAEQWKRLAGFVEALTAAGLAPAIISGGGTGTHHIDLEHGPFTELQAGSYILMDKQYGEVEIVPGGIPFKTSLGVLARVVSAIQADKVTIDAGTKAISTDFGPALIADGAPSGSVYQFMGDEHGAIKIPEGANKPPLGGLVRLIAPHCDPTVNLHDRFHVLRDGRLVDIWPIEARGY